MTAVAFCAAVDEPERFKRSRSVGAYFGLTPRRHASGEVNRTERISKSGGHAGENLSVRGRWRAAHG